MDIQDLKYKLEENKKQILTGVSAIAGLVLIGGGILMFTQERAYNEIAGPEIVLAEHLLVRNEDGDLDLYSVEENKKMDSLDLPDEVLVSSNQNLDGAYVYDKEGAEISKVKVEDDQLTLKSVQAVSGDARNDLMEATDFETTDNMFAFVSPQKLIVLDEKGVRVELEHEEKQPEAWNLSDSGLYVAKGDHLSYVDLETGDTSEIEIGEKTSLIHRMGNYIMAHNNFGSGLGESIILRLSPDSLHIEEMKSLDSLDYIKPAVPGDENQLVFLKIDKNDEGETVRKQLIVQNAVSVDNKELDAPLVLELSTEGDFRQETVLASNGFLYNFEQTNGEISITELRNGREYKSIATEGYSEEEPFFLPMYEE